MFLIERGKVKPICRACKALHTAKACPQRAAASQHAKQFFQDALALQREMTERQKVSAVPRPEPVTVRTLRKRAVEWLAVERQADEVCALSDAYWEQRIG